MHTRTLLFFTVLMGFCLSGCEQRQDEALNFYKQMQREAQLRDENATKQMDALKSELAAIGEAVATLQKQGGGGGAAQVTPEKIAEIVATQVAAKLEAQNAAMLAQMQGKVDEMKKVAAAAPPPQTPQPKPTVTDQRSTRSTPQPIDIRKDDGIRRSTDPTRTRIPMSFGDR